MMNATPEMRDARHELQVLSISDPAAAANMMRYVAALAILLTGRRARHRQPGEPEFAGVFRLDGGEQAVLAAAARTSGIDQVLVAFDVDDAAGPPIGFGLVRKVPGKVNLYPGCGIWSPANDGRALLVPSPTGELGHFAFRPGAALRHVAALPQGDLEAGYRRAAARLMRLVNSAELRDVHRGSFMHIVQNGDRGVFAKSRLLAA